MKRLPAEIDQLMWAVAENPNQQAVIEFEVRHPEFRLELLKRVEMVRGLRQEVKGPSFKSKEIPKFEPRTIHRGGIPRGAVTAAILAVAALSFAAFTAVHALNPTKPKPIPTQEFVSPTPSTPTVVYGNGLQQAPTVQTSPSLPADPPVRNETTPIATPPVPLEDKRRDLKLSGVDLVAALSLITSGTKMHLEVGPGFVNQKVTLNFTGKTTREMLLQMAKDYAFTVSDEGEDKYLILPVPDNAPELRIEEGKPSSERKVGP